MFSETRLTLDMKIVILVGIFCVITFGGAQEVAFHDCGSALGTISEVDIVPCPKLPCIFKSGTNVTVSIHFTANTAVTDAKSEVYGIIGPNPVPFPLSDDNACHFMKCPLAAGESTVYTNAVYVNPLYPALNVIVKWALVTNGGDIVCFTVPVTISA